MHWEILRGFLLGALGQALRAETHVLGGLVEARTGTKLALEGDSLQAGRLPGGWALPRGEEATCWRAHDGLLRLGAGALCAPDREAGTWESRVQPGACTASDSECVGETDSLPQVGHQLDLIPRP